MNNLLSKKLVKSYNVCAYFFSKNSVKYNYKEVDRFAILYNIEPNVNIFLNRF